MDVLCVGCGDDLSWKSSERRNLESVSSKPVLELWKTMFIQELNDKEIDVEGFVERLIKDHRICRKCFYAYDRLLKLQKSLEDKISDAVIVLLPTPRRKRRSDESSGSVPAKRLPLPPTVASGSKKSPVVAVRLLYLKI